MIELRDFREIWFHDFEYQSFPGEHVQVHCLVAYELRSGRRIRLWCDQLESPPYRMDSDCLFVSFNAAAELSAHLSLGWLLPIRILDLAQEFKCLTNGLVLPDGRGLLGAMSFYKLDAISVTEKDEMRDLAMRGGPFTDQEKSDLLAYYEQDVIALPKLLGRMWGKINLPQALHRGRFMRALAMVEWNGTPIDHETLAALRDNWEVIKLDLITDVDRNYGVFEGTSFRLKLFARWLQLHGIRNWPITDVGRLSKSDETFKQMGQAYPQLYRAPADRFERDSAIVKTAMAEASRIILNNKLELRTDGEPIHYPHRYFDKRGAGMWSTVMKVLKKVQQRQELLQTQIKMEFSLGGEIQHGTQTAY